MVHSPPCMDSIVVHTWNVYDIVYTHFCMQGSMVYVHTLGCNSIRSTPELHMDVHAHSCMDYSTHSCMDYIIIVHTPPWILS